MFEFKLILDYADGEGFGFNIHDALNWRRVVLLKLFWHMVFC